MAYGAALGDPDTGRLKSASRAALPGTATTMIAYGVSLTGSDAPYQMGASDVAAWAQQDRPTDATAIFPPDQLPAETPTSYSRAVVYYLNAKGRQVNAAAPGGHITTTEHDTYGNVVRELGAANRARALGAPNPAVRARELDTQRMFSANGLELVEELAPQHEVTLKNGTEAQARQHVVYTYDEGAPAGEAPHLPTTTAAGAKIAGQVQDADVRVTKTEYGGCASLRRPSPTPALAVSRSPSASSTTPAQASRRRAGCPRIRPAAARAAP
jgi:hypothetical protein